VCATYGVAGDGPPGLTKPSCLGEELASLHHHWRIILKIASVQVDGRLIKGPLKVIASQPVVLEHYAAPAPTGFRAVLGGVSAGTAANYSWHGFQASNSLTSDDLVKLLLKNGIAKEHAQSVADAALQVIQSEPTKVLLVAVSAGGTTWAALEATSKLFGVSISGLRKFFVSAVVATIAGGVYYWLRHHGYLQ
jgi:hypothetical protein